MDATFIGSGGPCLATGNVAVTSVSGSLPELGEQLVVQAATGWLNPTTAYKIGSAVAVLGRPGTADLYGRNDIVGLTPGCGPVSMTGHEIDLNNENQHYDGLLGAAPFCYGSVVVNASPCRTTAAYWAVGVGTGTHNRAYAASGNVRVGVDLSQCVGMTDAMIMPNGIPLSAMHPNGTKKPIIGIDGSGSIRLGSSGLTVTIDSPYVVPASDNASIFGTAQYRWGAMFSVNGVIQSSDVSLKEDIEFLPDSSEIVKRLAPRTYKWKDGKRTHWGFLARDVKEALEPTGRDFGGYVMGEDGRESIRPDQLIAILWKAVQELQERVESLSSP